MEFDRQGSGLLPLERFYSSAHSEVDTFRFMETIDYLDTIGAIDRASSPGHPQVRIANYVLGPSNCNAHSSHYVVCCLNECFVLMGELSSSIMGPAATPERLLEVVGNIS